MTSTTLNSTSSPSLWPQLWGWIDQPRKTLAIATARSGWSRWLIPFLVWVAAFGLAMTVQAPHMVELSREAMESQLAAMPPDQAEAAREAGQFAMTLPFMLAMTLVSGLLLFLVGLLVQATLFYFGAFLLGGSETNFSAMFTMTAWTRLPMAVAFLVQAAYVILTQQMIRYPGLSFLVATGNPIQDAQTPLYSLLANLEFFWLWQLFLAVAGLTVVARLHWGKALLLTLIYAALVLGLAVLPTLIFGQGMAG